MREFLRLAAMAATVGFVGAADAAPRIEGRLGYEDVAVGLDLGGLMTELTSDGISYGGEAGYDFDALPFFVIGAYGSFDLSDAEICDGLDCVENDWTAGAGVRAGFEPLPLVMIYAKGGYALADLSGQGNPDRQNGYQVGAGIEFDLITAAYVKAEFVYSDFGEKPFLGGSGGLTRNHAVVGLGLTF